MENYYLDPGEVNVHQFYPVLDLTFDKQLATFDNELFRATTETDSEPKKIVYESKEDISQTETTERQKDNDDEKKEETTEANDKKEKSDLLDKSVTESLGARDNSGSRSTQPDLFPTAVTEESIEAAKQRSQSMHLTKDLRGAGHQRIAGSKRILTQKANEYCQIAMEMKENQDLVGAITCLTKAINLMSSDPRFYVERGEAYLCLCDFQSAILNYKKACLLTNDSPTYYARLAFIYHFQGQTMFDQRLYSEALEAFSRASEMVPENVGYRMRSLVCLAALQRHDECLELVDKRLKIDKSNPDLYIVRARLSRMFANTSQCYNDVRDALALDSQHSEGLAMMEAIVMAANSHKHLAMQFSILGKEKEAVQKMTLAIQTNPYVADYHVLRGALQRQLKDFNSAVDDFLLALDKCGHNQLDPVFRQSQRQLLLTFNDFAVECFNKGQYQEAITLLSKALNEEKNEKSLYVNRGDCYFKEEEFIFALEDYQQALELDPQDQDIKMRVAFVYNQFAVDLFEDKDYIGAEAKFTNALEYSPHIGQFYISRSRTRCLMEDLTGAREDFLQGLLLSPMNEGIMTISSRLFPGKSIADVLSSPAAKYAQDKLNQLLATHSSNKHATSIQNDLLHNYGLIDSSEDGVTNHKDDQNVVQFESSCKPTESSLGFVMCMEDRQFDLKQVLDKRKVEHKVKDALLNRRSLRYNGPHLLPLPPKPQISNSTVQGNRKMVAAAAGKMKSLKQNKTNWRHFLPMIGGIKNVT